MGPGLLNPESRKLDIRQPRHASTFPFQSVINRLIISLFIIAKERNGSVEEFMYNVDVDGSSLLHLAVNSGVLGVGMLFFSRS